MAGSIAFIDTEVSEQDKKIHDIGAIRTDGASFHSSSAADLILFISGVDFVCGHNIVHHDLAYIKEELGREVGIRAIDTLYLSPLLFPKRPYHSLLKDDKLLTEELNNPVNDCKKAEKLFYDEVNAFNALPLFLKKIYYALLFPCTEFAGFFEYLDFPGHFMCQDTRALICTNFSGSICSHADLSALIKDYPIELAYTLALIWADDEFSITPPWVQRTFPRIENVIKLLRNTPCEDKCEYCRNLQKPDQ